MRLSERQHHSPITYSVWFVSCRQAIANSSQVKQKRWQQIRGGYYTMWDKEKKIANFAGTNRNGQKCTHRHEQWQEKLCTLKTHFSVAHGGEQSDSTREDHAKRASGKVCPFSACCLVMKSHSKGFNWSHFIWQCTVNTVCSKSLGCRGEGCHGDQQRIYGCSESCKISRYYRKGFEALSQGENDNLLWTQLNWAA